MEAGLGGGEVAGDDPTWPGLLGQLLLLLLPWEPQLANWPCRRASAVEGEDGSGERIFTAQMGVVSSAKASLTIIAKSANSHEKKQKIPKSQRTIFLKCPENLFFFPFQWTNT